MSSGRSSNSERLGSKLWGKVGFHAGSKMDDGLG